MSESDAGPSAEFLSRVRGEVKGKQVLGVASRRCVRTRCLRLMEIRIGWTTEDRFVEVSLAIEGPMGGCATDGTLFFFFDRVGDHYLNPE